MQDLWNFALELYAKPGVEKACLALQDSGSDVCLLLTGAWLQRRGVRCLNERLIALRNVAAPWQREVLAPLRQTRSDWRASAAQDAELASLRKEVKRLELEAERVLLERLQSLTENWPDEEGENAWLTALTDDNSAALQVLRGAIEPL